MTLESLRRLVSCGEGPTLEDSGVGLAMSWRLVDDTTAARAGRRVIPDYLQCRLNVGHFRAANTTHQAGAWRHRTTEASKKLLEET